MGEQALREFVREVASKTKKPFDHITLKKKQTVTETIECKGGFLYQNL